MREVCVGDGPTELEQSYSHLFPIQSWRTFMQMIRAQVNPLAGEDHLRELLQQLLIMGEVNIIFNIMTKNWIKAEKSSIF